MIIFSPSCRLYCIKLLPLLLAGMLACSSAAAIDGLPLDSAPPVPVTPASRFKAFTNRASEVALNAMGLLGIRYKMGGNSPESGLDCSGLVRHVFKQAWGTVLPRTAEEISRVGEQVNHNELRPGDLVFFNTLRRTFSHVGIYLGDNKFIHSPSAGGQVRIESMDLAYWKNRFNGARRINEPETSN
ncbi:C40 family peptidase [Janthinobacterium sp. 17J80-10]|uniref:C40 family peptidase n=1 Tax=Janthinobacterium sp. 17J80-10 TaxID=2497863 RepID=UPI001005A045|nr:C40 family peptidase [Janthinobacterium sp. 17J80-10]QAU34774.1 peptidoglycan endopeptidase [Janthinobacterium sp. 17J80-10]